MLPTDEVIAKSKPRFWAIVALTTGGDISSRTAWYIQKSPDAIERDICMECSSEDDGDDMRWAKDMPAGVYRLIMNPQGGEDWFELNVVKAEKLWELPEDASESSLTISQEV